LSDFTPLQSVQRLQQDGIALNLPEKQGRKTSSRKLLSIEFSALGVQCRISPSLHVTTLSLQVCIKPQG